MKKRFPDLYDGYLDYHDKVNFLCDLLESTALDQRDKEKILLKLEALLNDRVAEIAKSIR